MPWSKSNPPPPAKNWSGKKLEACIAAGNSALRDGKSEQDAIFACIGAAKQVEKKEQVQKVAIPVREKPAERKSFNKAFLGKGALDPDPDRSLVHADFDDQNRLVLTFDDGKRITTRAISIQEFVDNFVTISNNESVGAPAPSGINVRFTDQDTTITDSDDIVIATAACTITLPVLSQKTFRIKNVSVDDVVVDANGGTLIDGVETWTINQQYYSIDVHQSPNLYWVIL